MPVKTSTFSVEKPQIDGRVWVTETHTYDNGEVKSMMYLTEDHKDFAKVMESRAADLDAIEASVPQSISLVQAHRAIVETGIKDQFESAVSQATPDLQLLWYTSETVERDHSLWKELAVTIWPKDTTTYLDNLFRVGGKF